MVGLLENVSDKMTLDYKNESDLIFLIGKSTDDFCSSEYLHKIHGVEFSPAPRFDIEEEFQLQKKVAELIRKKIVESVHDVSEGGLFVTLLESAFVNDFGFNVKSPSNDIRKDAYWFGESQSRVVVSVSTSKLEDFKKAVEGHSYENIGIVTDKTVEVDGVNWGNIADWKEKYNTAIEQLLAGSETESALSSL